MKVLLGGIAAIALGIIWIGVLPDPFVGLLKGIIPLILLLGGGLATYTSMDEAKELLGYIIKQRQSKPEEVKKYKEEIEESKKQTNKLKEDIEGLKDKQDSTA